MAKKSIPIKLDKERNLRLGMVALDRIEKKTGKKISVLTAEQDISIEEVSVVIWAGLVHEDPDLTPEKVMELVDEYSNVGTAVSAMGEAMQEAFGKNG